MGWLFQGEIPMQIPVRGHRDRLVCRPGRVCGKVHKIDGRSGCRKEVGFLFDPLDFNQADSRMVIFVAVVDDDKFDRSIG